jgi:exopolysaccharide biosynthesis protein
MDVLDLMARENALLMINGDYVSKWDFGCVVKNGQVARQVDNPRYDACVLLRDGTMLTIDGDKASSEQILSLDPWQAWCFGPALLDENGQAKEKFNSALTGVNPRTVLGYYAPGHYCFVVVEGRRDKYSRGMDLKQLSRFMASLGCAAAYNLDGGNSSVMVWNNAVINTPSGGGRESSDALLIAEVNTHE